VLGDPLYRPFQHLRGSGVKREGDTEYRALRAAALQWMVDPQEQQRQLEKASARMKSGTLAEAVGLELLEEKNSAAAATWFRNAKLNYLKSEDKCRQDINLIGIERAANRKDAAVRGLQEALVTYGSFPEAEALRAWLLIVDPPPPPPPPAPKP
jgi:hypothetical protein